MKWSFKIARLAGIDINVHATFFLLLAWVAIGYWRAYGSINAVLEGVGFIVILFVCIVLHEMGHALTARHYGIGTKHITLLPIGGVAALEKMPDDPFEEVKVALAGPAVNFAIAAIIWLLLPYIYPNTTEQQLTEPDSPLLFRLMAINIIIAIFNLIPAFPMDGGRVLRALLSIQLGHKRATEKAAKVGQGFAFIMFFLGLLYNPFLMLIALFIWLGATAESTSESINYHLRKIKVSNAMIKEFHLLHPEDRLQKAVDLTIQTTQKDFPVVDSFNKSVMYQLTQDDLINAVNTYGDQTKISRLKLKPISITNLNGRIDKLLQKMGATDTVMVGVVENQELIGIIDLDNIKEIIKLHPMS